MARRSALASMLFAFLCGVLVQAVLFVAPAARAQTAVAPSAGMGTAGDPYQITEVGNLVWMGDNVSTAGATGKYYKLMNDIDASSTASWNDPPSDTSVLEGFHPIGINNTTSYYFRASFDGNGHSITGLTIHRDQRLTDYVGLFGILGSGGEVKNLELVGGTVTGHVWTGGMVGWNNGGTITNCHTNGTVSGTNNIGTLVGSNGGTMTNCYATGVVSGNGDIGGLAGSTRGTITDCYASSRVTGTVLVGGLLGDLSDGSGPVTNCHATGQVTGGNYTGGLVGNNYNGSVTGCYATGDVSGGDQVGGLIGVNGQGHAGSTANCYATGNVTGLTSVGGLVGRNDSSIAECYSTGRVTTGTSSIGGLVGDNPDGTVNSSYWNSQTSGQTVSAGGTPKTTAQMQQQVTFAGWDFANVWAIVENITYPFFRSQSPSVPTNVSPADAATGVAFTPTLAASAFTDADFGDTHAASQWQVRTAASPSNWSVTVCDSGTTSVSLTNCAVTSGVLVSLTDYLWRVRYEDNHAAWSPWSAPTTFQTLYQQVSAPTGLAASNGASPDRVRVVWTAQSGAADYTVCRSTHPTTATATAVSPWITGTFFDDLTAEPGVIYYYWVVAATDTLGGSMSNFSTRDSGWAGSGVAFPSNYQGNILIIH